MLVNNAREYKAMSVNYFAPAQRLNPQATIILRFVAVKTGPTRRRRLPLNPQATMNCRFAVVKKNRGADSF
jgi:hypothetical protein